MRFSNTLKNLREQKNVTQKQLAEYLKVTRSTIAGYETKGKQPDYERLLRIAAYFGVTVDYLLTGTDRESALINGPPSGKSVQILAGCRRLPEESQKRLEEYMQLLLLKEQSRNKKEP